MPDALLPTQILEQWGHLLSEGQLTPQEHALVETAVKHYLPPPTGPALRACRALQQDGQGLAGLREEQLESIITRLQLAPAQARQVGTLYPLFFALTQDTPKVRLSEPKKRAGHSLLVRYFSNVSPHATPGTYYPDVLAVRDTLADTLRNARDEDCQKLQDPQVALAAVQQQNKGRVLEGVKRDKLRRFEEILTGERQPGVPTNRRSFSPRTKRHRPPDRGEAELRAVMAAVPKCSDRAALQSLERAEEQPAAQNRTATFSGVPFKHAAPRQAAAAGDEPDDAASPDMVRRLMPSRLTPTDDLQLIRRQACIPATAGLRAETDFTHLPARRLAEALAVAADGEPGEWALAWLLLTTGLAVDRLTSMTTATEPPGDATPHWHPSSNQLRFRLLDGPAAADDGHNQVVVLDLPDSVGADLRACHLRGRRRLLRKALPRLNRRFRRTFRNRSGVNPTVWRLRSNAWFRVRAEARDAVAAMALSGQFGMTYAAPAAYRRFEETELQELFAATSRSLAEEAANALPTDAALQERLDGIQFFPLPHPAVTGSARAREPEAFAAAFDALRGAAIEAEHAALVEIFQGGPGLKARARAARLLAAYSYLTWLLSTGARPIARRTDFCLFSDSAKRGGGRGVRAYLSDKSNKVFRERRVIPVINRLVQQLRAVKALETAVSAALAGGDYVLSNAQPAEQTDLPALLVCRGRKATWRTFTHADLLETLTQLDFRAHSEWAHNVTRHTVATALRATVPEAGIDMLLGHATGGRAMFSRFIVEPASDWSALRSALEAILRRAGHRHLTLEDLHHVSAPR